jgi:hypothetical protein
MPQPLAASAICETRYAYYPEEEHTRPIARIELRAMICAAPRTGR